MPKTPALANQREIVLNGESQRPFVPDDGLVRPEYVPYLHQIGVPPALWEPFVRDLKAVVDAAYDALFPPLDW